MGIRKGARQVESDASGLRSGIKIIVVGDGDDTDTKSGAGGARCSVDGVDGLGVGRTRRMGTETYQAFETVKCD